MKKREWRREKKPAERKKNLIQQHQAKVSQPAISQLSHFQFGWNDDVRNLGALCIHHEIIYSIFNSYVHYYYSAFIIYWVRLPIIIACKWSCDLHNWYLPMLSELSTPHNSNKFQFDLTFFIILFLVFLLHKNAHTIFNVNFHSPFDSNSNQILKLYVVIGIYQFDESYRRITKQAPLNTLRSRSLKLRHYGVCTVKLYETDELLSKQNSFLNITTKYNNPRG